MIGQRQSFNCEPARGAIGYVGFEQALRSSVNHRADIGGKLRRIAHAQRRKPAADHVQHRIGNILLQIKHPQRRTALPRALECAADHVAHHLFGQGGAIDDHRVLPAGFRDQRGNRPVAHRQRAVDCARRVGRSGKGDAGKARVGSDHLADGAAAGEQLQRLGRDAGLMA